MKLIKDLTSCAPLIGAVVLAVCTGSSLSGYVAPVFEPIEVLAEEKIEQNEEIKDALEKGNFDLEDGIYEGTGTGFAGQIKVAVEIKDKTIISIKILDAGSDDTAFVSRAKGVIDKIIASQELDVDVVSGATYSSKGIISAVKNALTGEVDHNQTASLPTAQGSTTVSTVEEPSAYKDGTYYGSGTGFGGTTTVKVVISGGKITAIKIQSTNDDSSYIQSASTLISKIIAGQTTNVDTVSGATYSSVGIIQAVRNALSQAALNPTPDADEIVKEDEKDKEIEIIKGKIPYVDGIYYGIGEGYNADIKVAVEIKDKTIISIEIVEHDDDAAFMARAEKILENVVLSQTIEVDVVSGATYSSEGILEAIQNALIEADKATNGEDKEQPDESETESPDNDVSDGNETESPDKNEGEQPGRDDSDGEDTDAGSDDKEDGEADGSEIPDKFLYKDGEYTVTVLCEPDEDEDFETYHLSLKVQIKEDKIVSVTNIIGDGDASNDRYINWAANGRSNKAGVVTQILEKGMFAEKEEIDVVSRATCSSNSIIEACLKALEEAKITIEGAE